MINALIANVNDTNIYYEEKGAGYPLILVHGFGMDNRSWKYQFDYFSQHFRVIRYDLRGFGKSDVPTNTPYSHHDDLKSLLDYLKITKVHILGHSMGCRVATNFTITYPTYVTSLICADPGLEGESTLNNSSTKELFTELNKIWVTGQVSGLESAKKEFMNFSPLKYAMSNPKISNYIKEMINDYSGWHWINEDPYLPLKPITIECLDKIYNQTLLIIGGKNPFHYQKLSDIMLKKLPNASKVIIPKTGHMLQMEDPDKFNAELERFLSTIKY